MKYLKKFESFLSSDDEDFDDDDRIESDEVNEIAVAEAPVETELNFQEIYTKYWDTMLRMCYKYTSDTSTAEDYCQEGFIKVMNNLHKYDNTGSLEGWIKRVIRNSILDKLRSKKDKLAKPSGDDVDWERMDLVEEEPEESPHGHTMTDIKSAAEQLSPQYKEVFTRYFFKNMPHQEIADELGISVGTSKSNLSKAKRNIREILER